MSHLPFGLPVCLSRSQSLSFSFPEKFTHTHSYLFFCHLVSITLVGQPTLKKPFDFDHASISAPLGTLIQRAFLSPLWCTIVTHSSLTAVLPSSSSKKLWHKLPSTVQNAILHLGSLYPSTPQTSKQFRFLEKGCSWFEMLNGGCISFCFMQLYFHW